MANLTEDEKAAVRSSLAELYKDPRASMVHFYKTLIGNNRRYHQFFPGIQGVAVCDFAKNTYIRDKQGPRTGSIFFEIVSKLDNETELVTAVNGLVHAPQHVKIHMQEVDYRNAWEALLTTLKEVLGDKFSESDEAAWRKVVEYVMVLTVKQLQPTEEQKAAVRADLAEFMKNQKVNMAIYYNILFADNPEYLNHFPPLKDVRPQDLQNNAYFTDSLAPRIAGAFVDLIEKFDDPAALRRTVNETVSASQHIRQHLMKEDYENAFRSFLRALKKVHGDAFTACHDEAWEKVFSMVLNLIAQELTITAGEKAAVRSTLADFAKHKEAIAVWYQILHKAHPQYRHYFPQLEGVELRDYPTNQYLLEVQGPKSGGAIIELFSKIDNEAALQKAVHDVIYAPQHTRIPLRREDYQNSFNALLVAMRQVLGSRFTINDEQAWHKVFNIILHIFAKELTITLEQKTAVRSTLGEFLKEPRGSMAALFQALFTDHPEYQDQFPDLKGVSVADLAKNAYLRNSLGPRTSTLVFDVITKLDDDVELRKSIEKLIKAKPELRKEDYQNGFRALLSAHKKVLGDKFTGFDEEAWLKVMDVVVRLILQVSHQL